MSGKLIVDTITTERQDLNLIVDNNVTVNGTISAANISSDSNYNDVVAELTSIKERLALLESYTKIINLTTHENGVRRVLTPGLSIEMESFIVNKKSPTSTLLIQGTISGWKGHAGNMQQQWQYGDYVVDAQSVMYDENAWGRIYTTTALILSYPVTGDHIMTFRYCSNFDDNHMPFTVYNPNASDDLSYNRLNQTKSVYLVWEIEI